MGVAGEELKTNAGKACLIGIGRARGRCWVGTVCLLHMVGKNTRGRKMG